MAGTNFFSLLMLMIKRVALNIRGGNIVVKLSTHFGDFIV
jgi:hypothetical protein